jgi:hypothetical protein
MMGRRAVPRMFNLRTDGGDMRRDEAKGTWRVCCRVSDSVLEGVEASCMGGGKGVLSDEDMLIVGGIRRTGCERVQ